MREVLLVKLGGSLLTDKARPRTDRPEVLARLAAELAAARPGLDVSVLLGHGSGSFGHEAAHHHQLRGPLETETQRRGVAATQAAAGQLHRRVVDAFEAAGALPFSVSPSSAFVADGGRVVSAEVEPIVRAFDLGLMPIVYGDVVTDRRWGASILSTETVFLTLTDRLKRRGWRIRRAIFLGETAGMLDLAGKTLPFVESRNLEAVVASLGETRGIDVTGGMGLRLETCWRLARMGIPSFLGDGTRPGAFTAALRAETPRTTSAVLPTGPPTGTWILPHGKPEGSLPEAGSS